MNSNQKMLSNILTMVCSAQRQNLNGDGIIWVCWVISLNFRQCTHTILYIAKDSRGHKLSPLLAKNLKNIIKFVVIFIIAPATCQGANYYKTKVYFDTKAVMYDKGSVSKEFNARNWYDQIPHSFVLVLAWELQELGYK